MPCSPGVARKASLVNQSVREGRRLDGFETPPETASRSGLGRQGVRVAGSQVEVREFDAVASML